MTDRTVPPSNCWELVEQVLPVCDRVLLFGPPGVGKTHAATRLGRRPHQPVASCTVTPETPAAELRGFYVPRGNEFVWHDGPATACWRTGGRLVLNELERAGGDLLAYLLAVCDDPAVARLTLPSGETVSPAAGFAVVATMNGHPDALDPAVRDRFPVRIAIDQVAPGAVAALPPDLREVARRTATHTDPARRVSFRAWAEFHRLRAALGPQVAAQAVFGPRAADVLNALLIGKA